MATRRPNFEHACTQITDALEMCGTGSLPTNSEREWTVERCQAAWASLAAGAILIADERSELRIGSVCASLSGRRRAVCLQAADLRPFKGSSGFDVVDGARSRQRIAVR